MFSAYTTRNKNKEVDKLSFCFYLIVLGFVFFFNYGAKHKGSSIFQILGVDTKFQMNFWVQDKASF